MDKRKDVIRLATAGHTNKQIAKELGLKISAVRYYREPARISGKRNSQRRNRIKLKAVDYSGGRCLKCGYNVYQGALDFHHLDPDEKEFSIGTHGFTRGFSWDKIKTEVDKTMLVCKNCHTELHAGIWVITEDMITRQQKIRLAYQDKPVAAYSKQQIATSVNVVSVP